MGNHPSAAERKSEIISSIFFLKKKTFFLMTSNTGYVNMLGTQKKKFNLGYNLGYHLTLVMSYDLRYVYC